MNTNPYFYILQHKNSGIKYAGSRWAQGCGPSELLKLDGYLTSSNYIQEIIKNEGNDAFEIIECVEMDDPYSFETKFLIKNDCAQSDMWFNKHNNEGRPPAFGTEEFKRSMIEKYGVEHNTLIPEVKARMIKSQKQTNRENPEMVRNRALKIAENKRKNGTDGKGVPCPARTNSGNTKPRTEETKMKLSKSRIGKGTGDKNAMANAENRAKVAASKIGRKKAKNPITGETKMVYPDNIPDGFIIGFMG